MSLLSRSIHGIKEALITLAAPYLCIKGLPWRRKFKQLLYALFIYVPPSTDEMHWWAKRNRPYLDRLSAMTKEELSRHTEQLRRSERLWAVIGLLIFVTLFWLIELR